MKIQIIQIDDFASEIKLLQAKRKLLPADFEEFKRTLAENPEMGDLVPGTGGVRKIRIKSATKGKSGGFRICYYYGAEKIYLLLIYGKSSKENLTNDEKKILKDLVAILKRKMK